MAYRRSTRARRTARRAYSANTRRRAPARRRRSAPRAGRMPEIRIVLQTTDGNVGAGLTPRPGPQARGSKF